MPWTTGRRTSATPRRLWLRADAAHTATATLDALIAAVTAVYG